MKKLFSNIKTGHLFVLGLLLLLASQIPTFLLGTDSIVPYHDQLDGEIIAYIYQAKYLFSGQDIIPEFLNGASKTTLTPPAPLAVLLFCVFSPFTAYTIMQILGQIIAYIGMFLLIHHLSHHKYITFVVAILYAFLPFLPVYGLSQYGIPLLLVCFGSLYRQKHSVASFLYVAFYAGMSSLILCGFAWLAAGCILTVFFLITKRFQKQLRLLSAFGLMLVIYVLENLSLIGQILGFGNVFTSHKEEYTLSSVPFFTQFVTLLKENSDHVPDNHKWILFFVIGTLLFFALTYKQSTSETRKLCKWLLADMLLIGVLCAVAALWTTSWMVALRQNMGALKSFQISRVLWLTPVLWYMALSMCLLLLWRGRNLWKWLQYLFSFALLGMLSLTCLKFSFVKPCLQELLLPEYETISWSDYFALGVMEQVEEYLSTQEGLEKNEYKVASLGIDPSAALYHGFYCVDGYSNNYDLAYKHTFRKVIAPELEKNDWLCDYYDNWGNRCYLFAAEIPGYYNIEKGTSWYSNLHLDTQALKELGCDYILSAAYIVTAEDMNLTLLREEAFETESSYYRIYIYKITS